MTRQQKSSVLLAVHEATDDNAQGHSNALSRAIVVHGAWYVNEQVIGRSGMLGRSQGCFAVADSSLPEIMARLGPGRLIYADNDKVPA